MKTTKDVMDELQPLFLQCKNEIDKYPGVFELVEKDEVDGGGYIFEVNLSVLERLLETTNPAT